MSNYTIEKSDHKEWVNENCQPELGSVIQPDGWGLRSHLTEETWEKADFRLPSPTYTDVSSAVKVSLSTRSKKVYFSGFETKVRVQIIFVGDCEPDLIVHGWMWV